MALYLIKDTETSGIPNFRMPANAPGQPRMASLAAMLVDESGAEIDSFYHLVEPSQWSADDIDRSSDAFRINGLSIERLRDEGKPILEVLEAFDAFVERCEGITAYGIGFDSKIVRGEQRRINRPDRYGHRPVFCVQRACVDMCKIPPTDKMMASGRRWFKTPKLAEAVEILLGERLDGAHDALVDMRATARIFALMLGRGLVEWKVQEAKDAA